MCHSAYGTLASECLQALLARVRPPRWPLVGAVAAREKRPGAEGSCGRLVALAGWGSEWRHCHPRPPAPAFLLSPASRARLSRSPGENSWGCWAVAADVDMDFPRRSAAVSDSAWGRARAMWQVQGKGAVTPPLSN